MCLTPCCAKVQKQDELLCWSFVANVIMWPTWFATIEGWLVLSWLVHLLWGHTSRKWWSSKFSTLEPHFRTLLGRVVRLRYLLKKPFCSARPSQSSATPNRFKISKHIWTVRSCDGSSLLSSNFVVVSYGVHLEWVYKIPPPATVSLSLSQWTAFLRISWQRIKQSARNLPDYIKQVKYYITV